MANKARKAGCAYVQVTPTEGQMWRADVLIVHTKGNAETTRQLTTPSTITTTTTRVYTYVCMYVCGTTLSSTSICTYIFYMALAFVEVIIITHHGKEGDGVSGSDGKRTAFVVLLIARRKQTNIHKYSHSHTNTHTHRQISLVELWRSINSELTHSLTC